MSVKSVHRNTTALSYGGPTIYLFKMFETSFLAMQIHFTFINMRQYAISCSKNPLTILHAMRGLRYVYRKTVREIGGDGWAQYYATQ